MFQIVNYVLKKKEDCLMFCASTEVIKSDSKRFPSYIGGLNEDKLCDTLQGLAPTNVKMVH